MWALVKVVAIITGPIYVVSLLLGSFLLGFLAVWFRNRTELSPEWQALWTNELGGGVAVFSQIRQPTLGPGN